MLKERRQAVAVFSTTYMGLRWSEVKGSNLRCNFDEDIIVRMMMVRTCSYQEEV